jgi:hypothetical protein
MAACDVRDYSTLTFGEILESAQSQTAYTDPHR